MFNNSGISSSSFSTPKQILANVEFQESVGCVIPSTLGVAVGNRKIVKAGTPLVVDFMNLKTAAVLGDATHSFNSVLLHDVDVTSGNANGTALYAGTVNVNRVESDVVAKITTALTADKITALLVFIKA